MQLHFPKGLGFSIFVWGEIGSERTLCIHNATTSQYLENVLAYTIPRCNSISLVFRVKIRHGSMGLRFRVMAGVGHSSMGLRFRVGVGYSSMGLRFRARG